MKAEAPPVAASRTNARPKEDPGSTESSTRKRA